MWVLGLGARDVGLTFRGWPMQLAIGLVAGIAFGVLEYVILRPKPLIDELSFALFWSPALILGLSTGLTEELMFRGVIQRTSEAAMGLMGLFYTSAIFAVLHVGHLSVIDVVFVFLIAIFFTAMVKRTGSLLGVTLCHAVTNVILYLVAPFILA